VVKGNINLTNEMIDAANPRDNVKSNEVLTEMVSTLKGMEQKLFQLISTIDHEDMMNLTLLINDDLHKTLNRYKKLEKGQKPEAFIPSESNGNTSIVPTHVYESQEQKQKRKHASPAQPKPAQAASQSSSAQNVDLFDLMSDTGPSQQQPAQASGSGMGDIFGAASA